MLDCADLRSSGGIQATGLYKAHSWPPTAGTVMPTPELPPLPLSRARFMHSALNGPSPTPASAAMLPLPGMSAAEPMASAEKLTAELPSSAGAAGAGAAGVTEGLLHQALRTLYKQHYGVPSLMCAPSSSTRCPHLYIHSSITYTRQGKASMGRSLCTITACNQPMTSLRFPT